MLGEPENYINNSTYLQQQWLVQQSGLFNQMMATGLVQQNKIYQQMNQQYSQNGTNILTNIYPTGLVNPSHLVEENKNDPFTKPNAQCPFI